MLRVVLSTPMLGRMVVDHGCVRGFPCAGSMQKSLDARRRCIRATHVVGSVQDSVSELVADQLIRIRDSVCPAKNNDRTLKCAAPDIQIRRSGTWRAGVRANTNSATLPGLGQLLARCLGHGCVDEFRRVRGQDRVIRRDHTIDAWTPERFREIPDRDSLLAPDGALASDYHTGSGNPDRQKRNPRKNARDIHRITLYTIPVSRDTGAIR